MQFPWNYTCDSGEYKCSKISLFTVDLNLYHLYLSTSVHRDICAEAETDFCPDPDLILWVTWLQKRTSSHLTKSNLVTHWGETDILATLWMPLSIHDGENLPTPIRKCLVALGKVQIPTLCLHGGSWVCFSCHCSVQNRLA